MRMKHPWIGIAALMASLALGACAPTDTGDDAESPTPATSSPAASATATPYSLDDEY